MYIYVLTAANSVLAFSVVAVDEAALGCRVRRLELRALCRARQRPSEAPRGVVVAHRRLRRELLPLHPERRWWSRPPRRRRWRPVPVEVAAGEGRAREEESKEQKGSLNDIHGQLFTPCIYKRYFFIFFILSVGVLIPPLLHIHL